MKTLIAFAALLASCQQSTPPADPPAPKPAAAAPKQADPAPKQPDPAPKQAEKPAPQPQRNQKIVRGRATPGAKIALRWKAADTLAPSGESFTADADGNFTATVIYNKRPIALMAVDADQKCGGIVVLDEKNIDAPVTFTLEPLVTVKGHVRCPELDKLPDGVEVGISASSINIMTATPAAGKFSLRLPPGEYLVHARGAITMVQPVSQKLSLKEETDLGFLDLKLTPLGQNQGKEPPAWNVTAARGVDQSIKLSDYKGKWLLIEFWGFW